MRIIRASELGAYLYCQRAWWYQKRGLPSEKQVEMAEGTALHHRHGRAVMITGCLRTLAFTMIILALVLVALHFTGKFIG